MLSVRFQSSVATERMQEACHSVPGRLSILGGPPEVDLLIMTLCFVVIIQEMISDTCTRVNLLL